MNKSMSIAEQVKKQILFTVTDEDRVRIGNAVRESVSIDDVTEMVIQIIDSIEAWAQRDGVDIHTEPGYVRLAYIAREMFVQVHIRSLELTSEALTIGFNEVFGGEQHG